MYACNQPATFSPAILLLLHLALLISYPSPIPSYPPCSHIYGMVCFLLPFPAACYAHITRLGPRSCCCRLARQTRGEPGRIRRGKEQEQACKESSRAETPLLDEGALRPCHCAPPPSGRPLRATIFRPGRCHSCHRQCLGPLHRSQAKATFGQTQPGPNILWSHGTSPLAGDPKALLVPPVAE